MRELNIICYQDKPWVYAHLLEIQRRVGRENFPLIEQTFYPSHSDMVIMTPENVVETNYCPVRIIKATFPVSSKLATLMEVWAK